MPKNPFYRAKHSAILNRIYWGRIHDLCEGTDIKPWECVKFNGVAMFDNHPMLDPDLFDSYNFAVEKLEGLPVFVGDKVLNTVTRTEHSIRVDENGKVVPSFPADTSLWVWARSDETTQTKTPVEVTDCLDEAREIAYQCWKDKETLDIKLIPALHEAVAKRIAFWMAEAARNQNNTN